MCQAKEAIKSVGVRALQGAGGRLWSHKELDWKSQSLGQVLPLVKWTCTQIPSVSFTLA